MFLDKLEFVAIFVVLVAVLGSIFGAIDDGLGLSLTARAIGAAVVLVAPAVISYVVVYRSGWSIVRRK